MIRPALRDLRFWLLASAWLLVLATLVTPDIRLKHDAYDVLAIVDVTGSMNTPDMTAAGGPASRLEAVKDRLRGFAAKLPCQSRLGFGIFSERRAFVLFTPVEVCSNFAGIDASIAALDWRMAWEGDSYVANGIYDAIRYAGDLDADLLFFTDGHEAPPLPFSGTPKFEGKQGDVKGLIVGVGGLAPTPIPKFDDEGREIGVLGPEDVMQENRSGPPPPDAASRPGYHPKWAPFGNATSTGTQHLSSVKEEHLRLIASLTGLAYTTLGGTNALLAAFKAAAKPHEVIVETDIRAYPAGLALLLLVIAYGLLPLRDWLATRAAVPHSRRRQGLWSTSAKEEYA